MKLEGSCHCGAVRFSVESRTPVPFMRCYCSICRKTAGAGGFAINLGGDAATLEVEGEENITVFHARVDGRESEGERRFCRHCGSQLWVFDPSWPELVHPFAGAIDTPLPEAPEHVDIMLGSRPDWVPVPPEGEGSKHFDEYPDESLADWHKARGLWEE